MTENEFSKVKEMTDLMESLKDRMNDWDMRSALGICDSFARGGNCDVPAAKFDEEGKPMNRDGLAASFIEMVADLDIEESKVVRAEARRWLNAPFQGDPKLAAWRAARAQRGSLDSAKDTR